jgi:hypothetical protein
MLHYILPLIGIIGAFFLIRYRESLGDTLGEAEWMNSVGGIYNVIVIFAVFVFFWSIAELTGTNEVLFGFLKHLIPGLTPTETQPPIINSY